jgi:hypothetical protein
MQIAGRNRRFSIPMLRSAFCILHFAFCTVGFNASIRCLGPGLVAQEN